LLEKDQSLLVDNLGNMLISQEKYLDESRLNGYSLKNKTIIQLPIMKSKTCRIKLELTMDYTDDMKHKKLKRASSARKYNHKDKLNYGYKASSLKRSE
jgi:hypothetical protein